MKKYISMAMTLAIFGFSACTEDQMDEVNVDHSHPQGSAVTAGLQLSEAIMSTGFGSVSGDYAFYCASLTEQVMGTGNNQLMKAELRNSGELAASSTFNNTWNNGYYNLKNLKEMEVKITEGIASSGEQWDLLGAVQCLQALNWGILTDLHGDIPYAEALQEDIKQPNLSKQQEIYAGILATIDEAIKNLQRTDGNKGIKADQDLLFKGNTKQWLGLAYALKARYNLHKSAIDGGALAAAKAAAQQALDLGFAGAEITEFNGVTCDNPWSAYIWSRGYAAPSKTVANLMAANNDPRYAVYNGDAAGEPGDEEVAKISFFEDYSLYYDLGSQPIHVFSLHELYFILAECQARAGEDATEAFQAGINASINELKDWIEDFGEEGEDKICDLGFHHTVAAGGGQSFVETLEASLENIMIQKYLAMCIDEQVETYNDLRRCKAMGEEFIKMTNPKNTQGGLNRWPNMLPYGNGSVSSNPNIAAAFGDGMYIYEKKCWIYNK